MLLFLLHEMKKIKFTVGPQAEFARVAFGETKLILSSIIFVLVIIEKLWKYSYGIRAQSKLALQV